LPKPPRRPQCAPVYPCESSRGQHQLLHQDGASFFPLPIVRGGGRILSVARIFFLLSLLTLGFIFSDLRWQPPLKEYIIFASANDHDPFSLLNALRPLDVPTSDRKAPAVVQLTIDTGDLLSAAWSYRIHSIDPRHFTTRLCPDNGVLRIRSPRLSQWDNVLQVIVQCTGWSWWGAMHESLDKRCHTHYLGGTLVQRVIGAYLRRRALFIPLLRPKWPHL